MKLIRVGGSGKEKPGVILNEVMHDASSFGEDYNVYVVKRNWTFC
jgi:2,4-diketo-3-deoxy-L-fuconate hydrolase